MGGMSLFQKIVTWNAFFGWAAAALAQAPLLVTGVDDREVYADSVTFLVPAVNGFTYGVWLDGQRVPAGLEVGVTNADYHELSVARTNLATGEITNRLVRFILRSSERQNSEWGLAPWTPYALVNSTAGELAEARLRLLAPQDYPLGLEIPIVAWIEAESGRAVRANALLEADGHPSIQLRRGAGSGYLAATHPPGPLAYAARLPGLATNKVINLETNTAWSRVGGVLTGAVAWPPHSRMAVTNHLTIPAGSSLTIGEGAVIRLDRGVNITNDGSLVINGAAERPVVFTPFNRSQPWGGFFMRSNTSSLEANSTLFIASGADPKAGAGHRSEQCLFFLERRPRLALINCAALDLAGQFGHASSSVTNANDPHWTEVTIVRTLIQRCITGGEWNGCKFKFLSSAVLEVPQATPVFEDDDGDGLYFIQGETEVRDSVIGWTHDDGIDSGSGDGGSITASNVWMESIYHDAFAWSGGGGTPGPRRATNDHCVILNSGQGYECGWSRGGTAYSPFVSVQDSLALGNGVGARFGDNYDWEYYGFLRITNSLLLHNRRDVWGYNWQDDDEGWTYRKANMRVEGNYLTRPNSHHPTNSVWDPAVDSWRLAAFMTTPPGAPVGVAFATWTNQLSMGSLLHGVPVGLSSFTTNRVSVDYAFQDQDGILSTGTLHFAPGETVKRIYPAGFKAADKTWLQVVLSNPARGELTGLSAVTFQGRLPSAEVSLWVKGGQMDLARIQEGVPVALSVPSTETVTLQGRWETSGQVLTNISVTFLPGQTSQWIVPPEINSDHHPLFRLALDHSQGGPLRGPTNLYFVKTPRDLEPPAASLIARGDQWQYLDTVTNAVPGWSTPGDSDASWKEGPAPLGYGNSPEEATTVGYGPDSDGKHLTTYFRKHLVVTNALELHSLTFNLLCDDGAVVYLNGAEIYRDNMPDGNISHDTTAASTVSGTATVYSSTPRAAHTLPVPLRNGTNLVAVEIHQRSPDSSDILFDLEVLGHPAPSPGPQPPLYWGLFAGAELVLAWSDPSCILEQAQTLNGSYTNVVQQSPLTVSPTHAQSFYRLKK